jgi:glycolate oxidase iron-sulfur subunit
MQTHLAAEFQNTPDGDAAEAILRKCVHCGFCTATCPTYLLLGDELDGPRGRIYLMKQLLEGAPVSRSTQLHLDRCLTCRNCETTCPSGVEYGRLLDIGRKIVEQRVERPRGEQALRWLLKQGMTSPLFAPAMKLGQAVRPLLPAALKAKVPRGAGARARLWPTREHPRKVLLLLGCVQPSMMPNINSATARVLDAAGIQTLVADEAGCCGAVRTHLGDVAGGLDDMRRNVDAWWPLVEGLTSAGKVEAIVMNASGCGVTVKDYGHALRHDPDYADRAAKISALTRDLSELLGELAPRLRPKVKAPAQRRLAYHPPCTLQHGQQLRGAVETHLAALGFELSLAASESHLCCGSAGTYSMLQPELALRLRERKLDQLHALQPQAIVSANIGCIQHLQSGTATPVRHWVEVLDEALGD